MARRRRDNGDRKFEGLVKAGVALLILIAVGIGGISDFSQLVNRLVLVVIVVGVLLGVTAIGVALWRRRRGSDRGIAASAPPTPPVGSDRLSVGRGGGLPVAAQPATVTWNAETIRQRLDQIDWYQFEKFCAALLVADGFTVERRGGARPDGGVDLVVGKDGARALIQCKHWRTWKVKESTVREMLGSMTAFKTPQGAIYTLSDWTQPAAEFAAQHEITLVNGDELAASAAIQFRPEQLEKLLDTSVHHCPKCEFPMVYRTGNFTPFWGCSRYPACHGKLNDVGAR